jgi:hypothetical protein
MKVLRWGFTGTQRGMTQEQIKVFKRLFEVQRGLAASVEIPAELHHGDCIGADAQAHDMAVAVGICPVIHPPSDSGRRAFKKADDIRKPADYLKRNKNIVQATERLMAAPGEVIERMRGSGTWATIRAARKLRRPICIVRPDGSVWYEESSTMDWVV